MTAPTGTAQAAARDGFTFSAARRADAPAARVWAHMADVTAWPRWLPTVTRVDALASPVLALGARFRVRQPGLRPATWTVTELQPGRAFAWEASSPGLRLWANHAVTEPEPGVSAIVLEFRFQGLLAGVVVPLLGGLTKQHLATEAQALAAVAAAAPGSHGT